MQLGFLLGLELAAECHLAKIVQCAHLLQAPKYAPEDLANLSAVCFKLNSMQLGALLMQYKGNFFEYMFCKRNIYKNIKDLNST